MLKSFLKAFVYLTVLPFGFWLIQRFCDLVNWLYMTYAGASDIEASTWTFYTMVVLWVLSVCYMYAWFKHRLVPRLLAKARSKVTERP